MPTRSTLWRRSQRRSWQWPASSLLTCKLSARHDSATSSLCLPVSIPAAFMLIFDIFSGPFLVMRTSKFGQPFGSVEVSAAILLCGGPNDLVAYDPSADAPFRLCGPERGFLSEGQNLAARSNTRSLRITQWSQTHRCESRAGCYGWRA